MTQFNLPARRPADETQQRRLSEVFARLAAEGDGPVTIAAVRDALGDRSFAALLFFFAALNLLPLPPGTSAVLGLPLVLVAAQMVFGAHQVWLPQILLRKSIGRERFGMGSAKLGPYLMRLETFVTPRYWPIGDGQGDRIIGLVALVLGLAVVLPVPLGNWLPAFAAALISLALSERDGILLGIGILVGVLSLAVVAVVVSSAGAALAYMWTFAGLHQFW